MKQGINNTPITSTWWVGLLVKQTNPPTNQPTKELIIKTAD
jgi:hypothetical protein